MTNLLTPAALRLAAAALARAGAGSALAALVLLVLASTVRAEGAATNSSWEAVLATGADCPESSTAPRGGGWVLPVAHRAEGRFARRLLRPRQLPLGRKVLLLDRGGLPLARAP